ncbi:glycosyltransferase family 4 protein [Noviherbaspirillum denitrificans]|uniref:Glycosyl transferase n=1 Tax=Noviherbaspirillum denitrificans TaxID=1968433 RepID=A0A254TBB1_9BURK|nr:glycosyltransferase family 4 protein [Noviherbaspirillum denitrificans]OWW18562.1 glycosyl transferase [Noviherbaspirillum denitrificans]
MNRKIIISINTAWNIYNFRSGLIRALTQHGYEVVALAPRDDYAHRLPALGCRFIDLPMDSNGTHPGRDLALLIRYFRVLREERPLAYLGYTVKPNVYGSMAAQLLHIPVINNIAGLGTTFINNSFLTRIVRMLYRVSLQRSGRIFFQNADDQKLFIESQLVQPDRTDRLPGSGMDLSRYQPSPPLPPYGRPFVFLLVSRMLKDKGIEEFAGAARIVRQGFPNVEFRLLGFVDSANSNSISMEQIRAWEEAGTVRYLGQTDDVRPHLSASDCVVLPSYREGIPRSLLEAAAMARPIITTDTVGCRDVVDHKVNGLLCKVRDTLDLAEKMNQMLRLPPATRMEMGMAGRRKVEAQFDEKEVIQKYLNAINDLAGAAPRPGEHIGRLVPVSGSDTRKP